MVKVHRPNIRQGDIFFDTDFGEIVGSEQGGFRPCIVVSNNTCNTYSPTITVIPITSRVKREMPTHFGLSRTAYGLAENSVALAEQIRTIDISRLGRRHCASITGLALQELMHRVAIQLGLV